MYRPQAQAVKKKKLTKIFKIIPFQATEAQDPQLYFNYGIILANTKNTRGPTILT